MTEHYLSSVELAHELNVTRAAVSNWMKRFGPGSIDPFPEPDVYVGRSPGWHEDRVDEIIRWMKRP